MSPERILLVIVLLALAVALAGMLRGEGRAAERRLPDGQILRPTPGAKEGRAPARRGLAPLALRDDGELHVRALALAPPGVGDR